MCEGQRFRLLVPIGEWFLSLSNDGFLRIDNPTPTTEE